MQQYLSLLQDVYHRGELRGTRNAPALSVFDRRLEFDLAGRFPILTTKRVAYNIVFGELLAFLRGYSYIDDFAALGAGNIWAGDTAKYDGVSEGDMGRIYGVQWRRWRTHKPILATWEDPYGKDVPDNGPFPILGYKEVDQLRSLLDGLINDPTGRRHVVSAWNPGELDEMCLPPCHMFFQCYVERGQVLHLKMYQRSADLFLGVPFNVTSYATLLTLLADVCGYEPGRLTMEFGDVHIYEAHIPQVLEQLGRRPNQRQRPQLCCNIPYDAEREEALSRADFALWRLEQTQPADLEVVGYHPHPPIRAELLT